MPKDADWEWGGCSDNVNYGFKKSREFMDAPYRKRSDIKTLLKRHNNDAGRFVSFKTQARRPTGESSRVEPSGETGER